MRYPVSFNLKKHMDNAMSKDAEDQIYDLYGVVIHCGHSTNSGHYYSYCKAQSGKWFECDDSCISSATEKVALDQEAYLLFYQKRIEVKVQSPVKNNNDSLKQPTFKLIPSSNSSNSTQPSSTEETSAPKQLQIPLFKSSKPNDN